MKKYNVICCCIIVGCAIHGITISIFLYCVLDISKDILSIISTYTGAIGTILSIILSIMAMYYSNKSSEDASNSLNTINEYYKTYTEKIRENNIKQNLGKNSIDNIINSTFPSNESVEVLGVSSENL